MRLKFADGKIRNITTLGDVIPYLAPRQYFCVGSRSSFFFIGRVGEFKRDISIIDEHYRKSIDEFTPFLSRKLKEVYTRHVPDEPAMTVFLVEGVEVGRLWLLSEYDRMIALYKAEQRASA